jgi:XTP/dITP diphosphohydrolase
MIPLVIARASVKEAYQLLGAPVIKCDSGLRIPGLSGFPGPYSSYVQRTLGVDGLLKICDMLKDRSAVIYSVVAFCDECLDPVTFYSEMAGTLLKHKQGKHGYFFDFIFVPVGYSRTMAEFDDTERWQFWKGAYEQFAEWYATTNPNR